MVEFSFFSNSTGVSVAEIAALTGANPCAGADLSRLITGIAPIDHAGANDLTFVKDAQYAKALAGADLWQLHTSRYPDAANAPDEFIANVDDGTVTSFGLVLTASDDGSFRMTNPRTSFSKAYPRRHH